VDRSERRKSQRGNHIASEVMRRQRVAESRNFVFPGRWPCARFAFQRSEGPRPDQQPLVFPEGINDTSKQEGRRVAVLGAIPHRTA